MRGGGNFNTCIYLWACKSEDGLVKSSFCSDSICSPWKGSSMFSKCVLQLQASSMKAVQLLLMFLLLAYLFT